MIINRLYVKHFKGVKEVEIFAGDVNELSGPNGSGKSSVLDAIVAALAGQRSIDPKPLRDGETKGMVTVDMGDIVVTRKFAEGKTSTLTVKAAKGKVGQRDLDKLFTDFTFDPLYFAGQDAKKQVEILRHVAGPEFCARLERIDSEIGDAILDRTLTNRLLRQIGKLDIVVPVDPIDTSEVQKKLKAALKYNDDQTALMMIKEESTQRRDRMEAEVKALEEKLIVAKTNLRNAQADLDAAKAPAEKIDTSQLEAELAEAGRRAEQVAAYRQYQAKLKEREEQQQKSNALDKQIATLRESRERLAKTIELPVDGVTFDDNGVRVNGIPFEQLCTGERYKISAQIGCSINSELKIMRIKDGSLLDKDSFEAIKNIASAKGVQLWIESVTPHSNDAIELSEGEIKCEEIF